MVAAVFANSKQLEKKKCYYITPAYGTELVCQRGPGITLTIDRFLFDMLKSMFA